MQTALHLAALLIALCVLRLALLVWASKHATASISYYRTVGEDGVERDALSFSSGHDHSLIGRTLGRWYISRAERAYRRAQRRLEQGK